jgi:hypothetical protein
MLTKPPHSCYATTQPGSSDSEKVANVAETKVSIASVGELKIMGQLQKKLHVTIIFMQSVAPVEDKP